MYVPTKADKKKYKDMSVLIVTPCGGYSAPFRFTKAVVNMVSYSWMHGLKVYQMGGTERVVVHWARNDLARQARDHICEYTGEKFTHVLWLDDDSVFNPDLLVYLARHGEKDVVSALYFGRTRHLPVVYVKDNTPDKYKHFPLVQVPSAMMEVDAVGFGACLMRRDVFERMEEPYFAFNQAGEDIYFCVHAKEQGIRIWCDGSYMLGHIGDPQIVTEATYKRFLADHEEEFADKVQIKLGDRDGSRLDAG